MRATMELGDQLPTMSLDEMAKYLCNGQPGSETHERVVSELMRRQTIAQIDATTAQREAANAQIKAAQWAFWTVAIAALSTMISAYAVFYRH